MTTEFTKGVFRLAASTQYKRTDLELNENNALDNLRYSQLQYEFTNGNGLNKANLQHHSQRTLLDTATLNLNLDGDLTNIWGDTLYYEAVKVLIIRNTQTQDSRYLKVTYKDEVYYIGPEACRVLIEPNTTGLEQETPAGSEPDEPTMTFEAFGDVTFDLIVIGSTSEVSGA